MIENRPDNVDVTLVGRRVRPKARVRLHLLSQLDRRRDVRHIEKLPLTAPARTLIDLATTATDVELSRAVSEARALRLIRNGELEAALGRAGARAGVARMRAYLAQETEKGFTRKEAERRMQRLTTDAGLPQPRCNHKLLGKEVDFYWPENGVVVEVDGYQFHGHRSAFERDRKKDQLLTAAGYTVIRVTWRQLLHEPLRVAAVISAALAGRASRSAALAGRAIRSGG